MIKINLLPAHILERQRIRSVIILVIVVILLELAVLGFVMTRVRGQVADAERELAYWQDLAANVGKYDKAIQTTQAEAGFYGRWVTWDKQIDQYHAAWADTLAEMAKWIYSRVQIHSLAPSPLQVQIQGRTESLETFRKAYLNIIRSPVYANVAFSIGGVPGGWNQGAGARPAPGARARVGAARPAASGGLQLRLGGGRNEPSRSGARPAAGGVGPLARRTAGPGARGAARGAAALMTDRLPIAVTFVCTMRPEAARRLVPPRPPVGGAPAAGDRAGRAGGRGAQPGQIKLRLGGGRN
ncbi:MAG: hypothetical protein JSV65_17040 [Armatimonadota bacterium]|nr:MAG: hypothetical protein JSV65_17040 [Armatimonadota bacterium]